MSHHGRVISFNFRDFKRKDALIFEVMA